MATAVILAAGENARLQIAGLPPGHKPLLIWQDEVLIRRLARQCIEAKYDQTIIVVSPGNAQDICFAVEPWLDKIDFVMQPRPLGPQEAIDRTIDEISVSEYVTVFMADNWMEDRYVECQDIERITVTHDDDEAFTEMQWTRGTYLTFSHDDPPMFSALDKPRWLGPLCFMRLHWALGGRTWEESLGRARLRAVYINHSEDVKDFGRLGT